MINFKRWVIFVGIFVGLALLLGIPGDLLLDYWEIPEIWQVISGLLMGIACLFGAALIVDYMDRRKAK